VMLSDWLDIHAVVTGSRIEVGILIDFHQHLIPSASLDSVHAVDRRIRQYMLVKKLVQTKVSSKSKVKFSHTRYRALGPELIPVYRQSARR